MLKEKMSAKDSKTACDAMDDMEGEDEDDDTEEEKKAREAKEGKDKRAKDKRARDAEEKDKDMVSKSAMDAAIRRVASDTEASTMKRLSDIRAAERAVAPIIGEVSLGLDSATAIYAAALTDKDIDPAGVDPSAFPAMVGMLSKLANENGTRARLRLAHDAAPASERAEFEKANNIPAHRIRNLGA